MGQEQGGESVPGTVRGGLQIGRFDGPGLSLADREGGDGLLLVGGGPAQPGDDDPARAHPAHHIGRGQRVLERGRRAPREVFELEGVGNDDIRFWHGALAEELGDARAYEEAAVDTTHHWIAAIDRAPIGGPHLGDRVQDRLAEGRVAQIAAQHRVAPGEHAAFGDAPNDLGELGRIRDAAAPIAIGRMIRELDGIDWPDLVTEPLQRKHRGRVAHMAIGDGRLNREDVHGAPGVRVAPGHLVS